MSQPNKRKSASKKKQGSTDDSRLRFPKNSHFVPGERAVTELLRGGAERVLQILVESERSFPEIQSLLDGLASEGAPRIEMQKTEKDQLEALVGQGLARGLVAVAKPPKQWDLLELLQSLDAREDSKRRMLVLLDEIVDPHNYGAIIRSAEFFGADGVVQTHDRSAPLSSAAVRASAGGSERVPLAKVTNLCRALEECKSEGYWVVGTVVEGGQSIASLLESNIPNKLVLVLGSEQKGLRVTTRRACDYLVTIEGSGSLGSLNVSSAAAATMALLHQGNQATSKRV